MFQQRVGVVQNFENKHFFQGKVVGGGAILTPPKKGVKMGQKTPQKPGFWLIFKVLGPHSYGSYEEPDGEWLAEKICELLRSRSIKTASF